MENQSSAGVGNLLPGLAKSWKNWVPIFCRGKDLNSGYGTRIRPTYWCHKINSGLVPEFGRRIDVTLLLPLFRTLVFSLFFIGVFIFFARNGFFFFFFFFFFVFFFFLFFMVFFFFFFFLRRAIFFFSR